MTYQDAIQQTGIKDHIAGPAVYEIYREQHDPPLGDLTEGLV